LQKIFDKRINLNHPHSLMFEEVLHYHQQWYTNATMMVCNDDFSLIFEGYKAQPLKELKKEI
jgi:hypothetical protein